jgi:hypothetical protein
MVHPKTSGSAIHAVNAPATTFPVPIQDLPADVRQLISRSIRSVEQLEILLLLRERTEMEWTVPKVYEVILSTEVSVERWLEELVREGLVACDRTGTVRYTFAASPEIAEQVAELARCYRTLSVRVIEAIYRPRTDAAQEFADAFRLKNPKQP